MSLLASRVQVIDAARNLGVLFSSQLSMSAQASAPAASASSMLVWGRRQNPDTGFHQHSAGLLQFAVRHDHSGPSAVSPERRGTSHWTAVRRCEWVLLATSPPTSGIQAVHPRVPFVDRYCAPAYLAELSVRTSNMHGKEVTWPVRRPLFRHCRSLQRCGTVCLQPDITFGRFKRSLKTFVWLAGPRRLVARRKGRRLEIFFLTYLLTYNAGSCVAYPMICGDLRQHVIETGNSFFAEHCGRCYRWMTDLETWGLWVTWMRKGAEYVLNTGGGSNWTWTWTGCADILLVVLDFATVICI